MIVKKNSEYCDNRFNVIAMLRASMLSVDMPNVILQNLMTPAKDNFFCLCSLFYSKTITECLN